MKSIALKLPTISTGAEEMGLRKHFKPYDHLKWSTKRPQGKSYMTKQLKLEFALHLKQKNKNKKGVFKVTSGID